VTVLVFAQVRCLAVVVGGCRVHDGLVEHNTYAAAAAATVADDGGRSALLADLLAEVAGCFPRRETRRTCTEMVSGLLSELEDRNCWTLAEAAGHRGPGTAQAPSLPVPGGVGRGADAGHRRFLGRGAPR